MFFLNQPFISPVLNILPQGLENLYFAVLDAFRDGTLLYLHQKPLLHLYLFKLSVPASLLICKAPAAEDLSFGPEYSLLAGLVED